MTFQDMLDQFEIQGCIVVRRWNEDKNDWDVFYETNAYGRCITNKKHECQVVRIRYMFSVITYVENVETPQLVIELEEEED